MRTTNEEWKLDWYNTRAGRTIIKPTFADKLTAEDCLKLTIKKVRVPKEKKDNLIDFIKANYTQTHIAMSNKTIMLHKVITLNAAKKLYPDLKGVTWSDKGKDKKVKEVKFTKFYKA